MVDSFPVWVVSVVLIVAAVGMFFSLNTGLTGFAVENGEGINVLPEGVQKKMNEGEKAHFLVDGEWHTLSVEKAKEGHLRLVFSSTPITMNLMFDDEEWKSSDERVFTLDVNDDGVRDVNVYVKMVDGIPVVRYEKAKLAVAAFQTYVAPAEYPGWFTGKEVAEAQETVSERSSAVSREQPTKEEPAEIPEEPKKDSLIVRGIKSVWNFIKGIFT